MLSSLFMPPPYARRLRACCTWTPRPPDPCDPEMHRYDHAARVCRCGQQTAPEPAIKGGRQRTSKRKRPYDGHLT